jgi:hypothetical protein
VPETQFSKSAPNGIPDSEDDRKGGGSVSSVVVHKEFRKQRIERRGPIAKDVILDE